MCRSKRAAARATRSMSIRDDLYSRCGVLKASWLPYRGMLLPIAALAVQGRLPAVAGSGLERWFWSTAFGLGYEVAANTAVVADYQRLKQAGGELADLSVPKIYPDAIFYASRRRPAAIWRVFLCALAANGANDLSGERLAYREPGGGGTGPPEVVVASIYSTDDSPPSFDPPVHLRVLGMVLVNRQSRAALRRRGLSGIAEELAETFGRARAQEVMGAQLLPDPTDVSPTDIEAFLRARLQRLVQFLSGRGVVVERDQGI
jgi:hypothetical protein